jgi:hypothetical protein
MLIRGYRVSSMLRPLIVLTGVGLALAGCGSDAEGGGAPPPPRLAAPLTYERAGGLAPHQDKLVVQPDGSASLTVSGKTRTLKLPRSQVETIAADLERAQFAQVPATSTSPQPVPDAFAHRITYQGHTVITDDAAIPRTLRPLVGELGGVVDRHS